MAAYADLSDISHALQISDNDPAYSRTFSALGGDVKEAMRIVKVFHPALSPDVNAIGHLWSLLKQAIRRRLEWVGVIGGSGGGGVLIQANPG